MIKKSLIYDWVVSEFVPGRGRTVTVKTIVTEL